MPAKYVPYTPLTAACVCLASLLAVSHLLAQTAPAAHPQLTIKILDGEGALNNIHQRTAREPIIEVDDENHKPIAGAVVVFLLPSSGPSATFANGAQMLSMMTDTAGQAAIHGMHPNEIQGSFEIHVRVSYNGSTAEATIHQKNDPGNSSQSENNHASVGRAAVSQGVAHGLSKSILFIIGGAAAAGTVAAVIATQRGSGSNSITAGAPTIGSPPAAGVTANIISIPLQRHGR